jgi:hypothetical protein
MILTSIIRSFNFIIHSKGKIAHGTKLQFNIRIKKQVELMLVLTRIPISGYCF